MIFRKQLATCEGWFLFRRLHGDPTGYAMVNMNGTCDFCWANGTWPANDLHVIFEWKISFQSHQFSGCPGFFRAEAARWPSNRCSRLDWGSTPKGVVTNGRKLGRSRRFWRWRWKVRSVAKLTKLKLSLWMRSRSFLRSTTGAVPSQWPWIHKECLYRTCVCIGYSYGYGSKWEYTSPQYREGLTWSHTCVLLSL